MNRIEQLMLVKEALVTTAAKDFIIYIQDRYGKEMIRE